MKNLMKSLINQIIALKLLYRTYLDPSLRRSDQTASKVRRLFRRKARKVSALREEGILLIGIPESQVGESSDEIPQMGPANSVAISPQSVGTTLPIYNSKETTSGSYNFIGERSPSMLSTAHRLDERFDVSSTSDEHHETGVEMLHKPPPFEQVLSGALKADNSQQILKLLENHLQTVA